MLSRKINTFPVQKFFFHGLVLFLLVFIFPLRFVYPLEDSDCLECHGDEELVKETKTGEQKSLFVNETDFNAAVHKDNGCISCHTDIEKIPHAEILKTVKCSECHMDQQEIYQKSIHGQQSANGDTDVATCQDCHGIHYIKPVKDPESMVYPLHLPDTCGRCHGDEKLAEKHNIPIPDAYQKYLKSVHGKGLLKSGLLVSASCKDCHGAHDIKPNQDPQSRLFRNNIPSTCGSCHVGVLNEYQQSIHGRLFEQGDQKVPVCTNCHVTHTIGRTDKEEFKLDIILECGGCHQKLMATYRNSYHGQVSALGYTTVARCSDCHGAHNILPPDEPASTLSPENVISTCQKCHPSANENFTKYEAHADYHDKQKFPVFYYTWLFMTALLFSVFAFFGLHTTLWFIRSNVDRLRKHKGETK